jgi:hypothetical protein
MRSYLHNPDEAFFQGQQPKLVRRMGFAEDAMAKEPGDPSDAPFLEAAVDTAFTLARIQWGLGEPLADVVATLGRTCDRIRHALARGLVPGPRIADLWLEIAIIGGDAATASAIGERLRRGEIAGLAERGEVAQWFLVGLRALMDGDDAAAAEASDALRPWLENPRTAPPEASGFAAVDLLIGATARHDQDAFDRAVDARVQARVAAYGRSGELRRSASGLLDAAGTAVTRFAAQRGLSPPVGNPYLATELLAATTWPPGGSPP